LFLITGGDSDPQLICLIKRAALHGVNMHALLTGQSGTPRINWDIKANTLNEGQHTLKPIAAFIRQDVFTYLQSKDENDRAIAQEWFVTLAGWLMSNPDIKVFNRDYLRYGPVNKPHTLHLAVKLGFDIADSYITNDGMYMDQLVQQSNWITKPVTGGAHCEPLTTNGMVTGLAYPQIIQYRLEQPELRIFRVGKNWFGFNIISDALDYRSSPATTVQAATVPKELLSKMTQLTDQLGLDFAAADFKTDPKTKKLQFLEINTNPMFVGFDQYVDGALCDAILENLGCMDISHKHQK